MKTYKYRFYKIEGEGTFGKVIKIYKRKNYEDLDFYVVKLFNKLDGYKNQ